MALIRHRLQADSAANPAAPTAGAHDRAGPGGHGEADGPEVEDRRAPDGRVAHQDAGQGAAPHAPGSDRRRP